ncbi:hypothetical protein J437_LFUL001782 [Ladona fulva]|uniref:UBA-like domain-containing protein n=1 Tax=Ladona fulva TaxID=123851 RepID=A0A8K0NWA0_LADFU|nr:hypothetical protein J437_LFUL001782 [Ladona fulva]
MELQSSAKEEDFENLSAEKCQALVEKFAEITETDEACAQFYLQDRQWNLERSVSDYFEAANTSRASTSSHFEISNAGQELLNALGPGYELTTEPPPRFYFVSWNIDGLQHKNLKIRTKAELIPETIDYIEEKLPEYHVISGRMGEEDYFSGVLLLRFTVQYESHKIIPHETSHMKRNLLCVKACIGDTKFELVNSHLESTKDYKVERIKQLQTAFKYIKSHSLDRTAIFAGDLNLRDKEVDLAGGVPSGVDDLWEVCGSRPEARYTWDTKRNSNAQQLIAGTGAGYKGFWPRMRFDRGYIRYSPKRNVVPRHFGLLGIQKVAGIQSFPSDHWGIRTWFDIRRPEDVKVKREWTESDFESDDESSTKKARDLIPLTIEYIEDKLPQYHVISGRIRKERSFTAILLLRSTVQHEFHKIFPHKTSRMKRNLLCVKASIGEIKLELVNTHLETGRENSEERINQLRAAFSYIKSNSMDRTAIFAGDLNLRDKEVQLSGGVPLGVDDLWEVCGSRANMQYTWDTQNNSNAKKMILKVMGCQGFWARMRFDRGYIRYSPQRDVIPKEFSLIGKHKIKGTGRRNVFPSDHWGIKILFEIRREEDSKEPKGNETLETGTSSS